MVCYVSEKEKPPEMQEAFPNECECVSACEEVFDLLDEDVAAHVGDGFGEGELFGAGLDAVLCEAALLNTAVSG
jgi:hypothetical protein